MPDMPTWNLREDIAELVEEEGGIWEDESWRPILVTVMSGIECDGRDIPLMWQIEFEPFGEEFEAANSRLAEMGIDRDGYGWGQFIVNSIGEVNPDLAERLDTLDCERSTCVISVESAKDFRELLETTWKLIFEA